MNEQAGEARDLNHPYAYAYAIPAATDLEPYSELAVQATGEDEIDHSSSRKSALVSAIVHMLILVVGGLVFTTIKRPASIEIQITKGPVASDQPVETFVMDATPDAPETDDAPSTEEWAEPELDVVELTLASMADVEFSKTMTAVGNVGAPEPAKGKSGQGSKFFGMAAYGKKFVYVVDISGSMATASRYGETSEALMLAGVDLFKRRRSLHDSLFRSRFDVARTELLRSINELKEEQSFCVMMFSSDTYFMFEERPRLISATSQNKKRIADWVNELEPGGGTDPRNGLQNAFLLKPDAVFLLSDGEFNGPAGNVERIIRHYRTEDTPLHTIAFESLSNRNRLRRMSESTNGRHRYVGNETRQQLLIWDIKNGSSLDTKNALQKIIDEEISLTDQEKAEIGLICCKLLLSSDLSTSRYAHECMVTMANETDLGPTNRGRRRVVLAATRRWRSHWQSLANQ